MGKKITELTELDEAPASGDYLPMVDVSAGVTKKITALNLLSAAGGGGGVAYGSYANLASVTGMSDGDLYFFDGTDETQYTHAIYQTSAWVLYFHGYKCTPPVLGDFTWDNQGTAVANTVGGSLIMGNAPSASGNLRVLHKSAPSTPYTIEALMLVHNFTASTNTNGGVVFRQSSDGKIVAFYFARETVNHQKWTSSTLYSGSSYTTLGNNWYTGPYWLRIADDGTNRITSASRDGFRFNVIHTIGRTDFLTANQVGLIIQNISGSTSPEYNFLSWKES